MLTLDLGPDLKLPALEAQTQTYVVYGGKGMGKTSCTAVFSEELARNNLKFSLLDPVGVSWGLKHSSDGRGPGIGVLILGGIHGDMPIEPTGGSIVADFVVDEDVSVIIDISRKPDGRMWSHSEQIKFVRDYCTQLFARQGERRRPLMQLIDECGRFAPEQPPSGAVDLVACKSSIEQLVEWGRNVGIGVFLTTQRSARMAKAVSELADVMIAFRTIGPRSVGAIVDWFGDHVEKDKQRGYIKAIRELVRGTAMIVSPGWLRLEGQYALRARNTFDSSATPVAGKERKPSGKGTRLPDLDKYRVLMAETIEKAQATDPRVLLRKIAELEKQLAKRDAAPPAPVAKAETKIETEVVEVVPDDIWKIHGLLADLTAMFNDIERIGHSGLAPIAAAMKTMEKARKAMDDQIKKRPAQKHRSTQAQKPPPATPVPARAPKPMSEMGDPPSVAGIADADIKVLSVLHHYPQGLSKNRLAVLAGHSPKKSTIRSILGRLRAAGLISPGGIDPIVETDEGATFIEPYVVPLPTGRELLDWWCNEIGETDAKVLKVFVDAYPAAVSKEQAALAAGHDPEKSTIRSILGRLRNRGLVDGNRAAEGFMEAIAS